MVVTVTAAAFLAVAPGAAVASAGAHPARAHSTRTTRCSRAVAAAVTAAFGTAFDRSNGAEPDARAAALDGGDDPALRAVLDAWLADPGARSTSLTADHVRCHGRTRASATTELVLSGTPMAAALPRGDAVLVDGTWKVARRTFCARMILENPALASSGACATRLGRRG